MSVRYIGRDNARKRLEPLEGSTGRSVYADGAASLFGAETLVVRPTFGLVHERTYETVHVAPLLAAIGADHLVAVLLVRLGGYAVGVFEGEQLVASKVGSRFVKNRHKKGGSSSNRFRRRRVEQAKALVEEAGEVAATVLTPWRDRAEFAALGGDQRAVEAALATRPDLTWLRERAIPRFLDVSEPRQRTLEALPYNLYAVQFEAVSDTGGFDAD